MILSPDSESLREFNACHDPDSGQFCSTQGVGSAAFKAWFGQSKVVDAGGKPLRAFHGTSAEDFDAFITTNPTGRTPPPRSAWAGDVGAWFTAPSLHTGNYDDENAEFVAGDFAMGGKLDWDPITPRARIVPVYLRIENPREYQDHDEFLDDLANPPLVRGVRPEGATRGARLRNALMHHGFDGFVIRNSMTDGDVDRDDWVAFSPEQIKSAIGNRGTWSRHSRKMAEANSCHTPAGSAKGGQFCSKGTRGAGSTSPARQAAERVTQAAERIGRRLGVKPGRVWVSHEARTFESGGLAFTEAGSYDPKSGTITINARTSGDVDAVLAHEMTHHQFWTVKRLAGTGDVRAQRFMAQAGLGMAANMREVQAQLRKDDGVTPYSRAYWRSAKPGDFVAYQSAVDETLGELAALEHGQRDRIGTKAAHARWRSLAKALRAAYPKES